MSGSDCNFYDKRIAFLKAMIEETERKLSDNYPEGGLRISRSNGCPQYYHRRDKADRLGKYIPKKERSTAEQLAQKQYETEVVHAAKEELHLLEIRKEMDSVLPPEEVYSSLTEERRKLVRPVLESEDMFVQEWVSRTYTGLAFSEDSPELLTDRGERVRSKSELIIANLLSKEGIPYKYECPLRLKGFGTVHPDFTALRRNARREIYWEHLGMMDDPEYTARAVRKISAYILNGFYPGEDLIITAETNASPINIRELREIIRHYLM